MNESTLLCPVGMVGYGSMGAAMARAMLRALRSGAEYRARFSLCVYAKNKQPQADMDAGLCFASSLRELALACGIIIIAVRPEQVAGVMAELAALPPRQGGRRIVVSVAAGVTLASLRQMAAESATVMRVMPNTLVEVGKGLFGLCAGAEVMPAEKDAVRALFDGLGTVVDLDESGMNAFTALAGCGPGFVFHILDALCEAGVSAGLGREDARTIAAALLEGCGSLAAATGRHPVILREQGTSPAGMTIAGLNHLDRTGVRGHIIDAVLEALERGRRMDEELA